MKMMDVLIALQSTEFFFGQGYAPDPLGSLVGWEGGPIDAAKVCLLETGDKTHRLGVSSANMCGCISCDKSAA